jgi:hypothetical protein
MAAILKSGDLPSHDIVELSGRIKPADGEPVRIWAEGLDGWSLDYWGGLDAPVAWNRAWESPEKIPGREAMSRAISGRIFAPSGELRWRIIERPSVLEPGRCRAVFLGRSDWLPGLLTARDELERLRMVPVPGTTLLWGQRTAHSEGDWIELRIPHRFRYPVEVSPVAATGDRPVGVQVLTESWIDRSGQSHFLRLCDLSPYTIEER